MAQPSWISNQNDFTIFYLQVILMLPTQFRVTWPFGSGEEAKNIDFQDGQYGFSIGTILAIFDLRHPEIPTKFQVNWPFGSGEEAKSRFSRLRPSWISELNDFS